MNLLAMGGVGAAVGTFWSSIQSAFEYIRRFIIVEQVFTDPYRTVGQDFYRNILEDYVMLPGSKKVYEWVMYYDSEGNRKYGWKLSVYGLLRHRSKFSIIYLDYAENAVFLNYLRGTFDVFKYLPKDRANNGEDSGKRKFPLSHFFIQTISKKKEMIPSSFERSDSDSISALSGSSSKAYVDWWNIQNIDGSPFKDSFYPKANDSLPDTGYVLNKALMEVEEEILKWLDLEKWYTKRGIPWKRGYLLYGPPGTGKTAFVRHLAMKFGIPLRILDLQSFHTNSELIEVVSNISGFSILLIEDVDSVFRGREAVSKNTHSDLTYDGFLNALDGVEIFSGIVFITTNHIELLDPALIRPGRIDRQILVSYPDEEQRKGIVSKILDQDIHFAVHATEGMSCAEVQEYCVSKALKELWND